MRKQLGMQRRGFWETRGLGVALVLATLSSLGCRVTEEDIERWATRASGPKKLVAVLQHEKYARPLRVDAALTLITMKPRGGQAVGLQGGEETKGLLTALGELTPEERRPIVQGIVGPLEEGMKRGLVDGQDPTFPYKDAAYALLTQEGNLVDDPATKQRLRTALIGWTQRDFERRMDDTSQLYGMEQLLRLLRDDAMKGLTPLLEPGFKKMRALSKLISELGSDETKLAASKRLVKTAAFVASEEWIQKQKAGVQKANEKAGHKVSESQLKKQLEKYQEEELVRVFGAMKFIGQTPAADYLIGLALDDKLSEERRKAAVAALEGNLDKTSNEHAQAMLKLLSDDTCPDGLRDLAARRIGELSRVRVADDLFRLLSHKRWQIRWTAASLLLKMSSKDQVDEFMSALSHVRTLAMTEALTYGPLLAEISGADGRELALKYAERTYKPPVRVSALGYFYRHGDENDVAALEPYVSDRTRVPRCPQNPDGPGDAPGCFWTCTVTEEGRSTPREITTVGEFVDSCLIFAMKSRKAEARPPQGQDDQSKSAQKPESGDPNQPAKK